MRLTTETYGDVAEKALKDLRDEMERPKIQNKKITINT